MTKQMRAVAVLVLVALVSTGCIKGVRAGQRCRTADFGDDGSHVLACKNGRWQRAMTREQAAQIILKIIELKRAQAAPQTGTPGGGGGGYVGPGIPGGGPLGTVPESAPANTAASKLGAVYAVTADQASNPGMPAEISSQLEATNSWFIGQSGGRPLDFIRNATGSIEVAQIRLGLTAAEIDGSADPRAALRAELVRLGMTTSPIAPVVFVHLANGGCGTGSDLAVIWMSKASGECSGSPTLAARSAQEIAHLMGAVPGCAPHHAGNGGVGDFSNDLMYEGPGKVFESMLLDANHDDYYGHGRADCYDIARSPLWV